ncbi:hypothetical protein LZ198_00430 [Myxococcus sp. K15C18031901]|uniref:hypothetical protein n=1 Tax=Myxococcus dinghuensis TaxID=2906761 RepID=UPI0020A7D306|nr:hypothetical protein [Myxococcus dinghuensis]MCP3097330.1 hypothetical protein [Myxococcus dinghuensis]
MGDPEAFVECMCFVFNAYVAPETRKYDDKLPCVCRSSFGFKGASSRADTRAFERAGLVPTVSAILSPESL